MLERTQLHAHFVDRFHFGERPCPCERAALDEVDSALDTLLPTAYRLFLMTHGKVFTPDLWQAVVEAQLEMRPLREFLSPADVIADTRGYWSAGMPRNFIGVATDFMGNLFGFWRLPRHGERSDDLPLHLFDHDHMRIVPVAESFDRWLSWYLDHA